jgi:hypothetical protein
VRKRALRCALPPARRLGTTAGTGLSIVSIVRAERSTIGRGGELRNDLRTCEQTSEAKVAYERLHSMEA